MENFINHEYGEQLLSFTSTDNEKLFRKNKKRQPLDWIYRNKDISYSLNEQGFREKSFKDIDWKNSIVLIGCSITYGEGLAVEDTISKQLEAIVDLPVINLGVLGSGIDLACWNSTILNDCYLAPKALVQVWSGLSRYTDFDKTNNNKIYQYFVSQRDYHHELDWKHRSKRYVQTDKALWRNKTIYYEISFFEHTSNDFKVDFVSTSDRARDLLHPGINSAKTAANKIAKNLYKQGL